MEQMLKPLHLACLEDELRPNFALIQIKDGIASATNGIIVARIDLRKDSLLDNTTIDLMNGKYIHMEAWKEAHKCDELKVDEDGFHIFKKGVWKNIDFATANGEFFNIQHVIDAVKEKGENSVKMISYSPKQLEIIGKIFDKQQLIFSFTSEKSGTVVMSNDDSVWALIMPATIDGIIRYFI